MANIHTPKTILRKGKEVWNSKKEKKRHSQATKVERTGQNTFNVHHDDGSTFECKLDPSKVRFREDRMKDAGGGGRFFVSGEMVGSRNVMSNADRRKMGLEQDPELPDYQK